MIFFEGITRHRKGRRRKVHIWVYDMDRICRYCSTSKVIFGLFFSWTKFTLRLAYWLKAQELTLSFALLKWDVMAGFVTCMLSKIGEKLRYSSVILILLVLLLAQTLFSRCSSQLAINWALILAILLFVTTLSSLAFCCQASSITFFNWKKQ